MAGKTTDWWGRLVVALHKGTYEVLAENEVKGMVLVQLPDGSVYSVERLGATTRE
jgi:hypothetical protein